MIIGLLASHRRHWLNEELEENRQKSRHSISLQLKDNKTPQLRLEFGVLSKLNIGTLMRKRNKIFSGIIGVVLIVILVFGDKVEDGFSCLAYYDQCTADRVLGLTRDQCLKRDDSVAFLIKDEVCLVKPAD